MAVKLWLHPTDVLSFVSLFEVLAYRNQPLKKRKISNNQIIIGLSKHERIIIATLSSE